jgi:hypothetical protein
MRKLSIAFSMLSLFATPEKATEIEGDLIEQSRSRGRGWMVYQVLLTSFALFRASVQKNIVYVVLLSYGTYELTAKTFFWGIRPLEAFLFYDLSLPASIERPLIYTLISMSSLVVGAGLVTFIPRLGAQVAIGTIGFIFLRLAVLQEGFSIFQVSFYGAVPLLLGAFLANRRDLVRSVRSQARV